MPNESDLELIDAVYAASTEAGTLNDAIQLFNKLQESPGGAVFHYDSIMEETTRTEFVTVDAKMQTYVEDVFSAFSGPDGVFESPLITAGFDDLIAGKILVGDDVIPFSEFSKSAYYKEIFVPLGIRWTMAWVASGRGQQWPTYCVNRTEDAGEFLPHHFERAKLFRRHLARALHIIELLDEAADSKLVLEQSMDRVPQAIVVVDDHLGIEFCNNEAFKLIAQSQALSESGSKLRVGATAHERSKFEQWWAILIRSQVSDGACFDDIAMAPVWEIEVSRLAAVSSGGRDRRRWMLTLKQTADVEGISTDYIIKSYGLTKSEAKVCAVLCRNGDAVSTAKAMGISPHTVRTHLKSVFNKTSTRSQVQLAVKLVSQK